MSPSPHFHILPCCLAMTAKNMAEYGNGVRVTQSPPLQTAIDTEQWQRILEVGMWEVPTLRLCMLKLYPSLVIFLYIKAILK